MSYQYRREPLTSEEVEALEKAAESPGDRLIVYVLLDLGLRVSELCAISRYNTDWQARRITVFGKGGPTGPHSKRRVLPLTLRTFQVLQYHLAMSDCLTLNPRSVQRRLRVLAQRAGIVHKLSPHVLRHTFAVACVRRGISLPALMALLGHERIGTTQAYLNLSPELVLAEFRERTPEANI